MPTSCDRYELSRFCFQKVERSFWGNCAYFYHDYVQSWQGVLTSDVYQVWSVERDIPDDSDLVDETRTVTVTVTTNINVVGV